MNYSGISECDVLNGTGFRVVLFVSGCSHKCYNCQNPKTWNRNFGHPFTEKTKEYLLGCLSKDYIDGITLTGGDPLYESNLSDVLSLVKEIRISFPEKTIWLYTGYKLFINYPESHRQHKYILSTKPNALTNIIYDNDLFLKKQEEDKKRSEIISLCDVVVDGEYIDEQRDIALKWRGSSNQQVIDVRQSLAQGKVVLYCD